MKISIDPIFLVTNECVNVTSAMRKNQRWASSGVASILGSSPASALDDNEDENEVTSKLNSRRNENGQEYELMDNFASLRASLRQYQTSFDQFSVLKLLTPFLEIIRSQTTTGAITLISLNSIGKFLMYGIIQKGSVELQPALQELAAAITHCRFQATDQNEDDAVLLKILSLMEEVVCSENGALLNDESVCEIVETCLSMACQMRRGDVLRRNAEMSMIRLSNAVFERFKAMEPEEDDEIIDESGNVEMEKEDEHGQQVENIESTIKVTGEEFSNNNKNKSYGVASIREVFRVLVSILDPANHHQYTDSTRIMALRLINVAFEVAGRDFANHKSLLNLITNKLSKHLFQLIRNDNPALLQNALQVIETLLHTSRKHLKMQQEFFFSYLLTTLSPITEIPREPDVDKIFYEGVPNVPKLVKASSHPVRTQASTPVNGRSSTPVQNGSSSNGNGNGGVHWKSSESREIMVEAITGLARIPDFFTDLYVNYDCDVDRTDLCEDLIGFLCRNAYPDTAQWSTASVPPLCLEAVLSLLSSMTNNLQDELSIDVKTQQEVDKLMMKKAQKKEAIAVASAFNEKPKIGISMLAERGITRDTSPKSIAKWLRTSGRIEKKQLGEYLTRTENKQVMDSFIELFDFSRMRLDEALRDFLTSFRLPGESALIEKLFEKFATEYCSGEGNLEDINNEDACFVLSYAIIMLNVDQHSMKNKTRMTVEDFKRNLRGANDGKDFRPEYLEDIYKTIKNREIIMPDEHDNEETFEYAWKSLLLRTAQAGELMTDDYNSFAYDRYVFQTAWTPIVTTLAYIFATASDDLVISRVITGFDQMARLGAYYQVEGVLDHIVECLSRMSTLGAGDQTAPTTNVEIRVENDEGYITVSDLSIAFGNDGKAQMSSIVLFKIVNNYAQYLNQAWDFVLPALANLYLYSLLDSPYSLELEEKFGAKKLGKVKPAFTFTRNKGGRDVGLFSAISNYLSGGDNQQEPNDEDIDYTLSSIDCIKMCNLNNLFDTLKSMDNQSVGVFVSWVIANLPKLNEHKQAFYPVTLFYLELATTLCNKDDGDSNVKVWSTLNTYLKNWQSFEPEFLMRVVNYVLVVILGGEEENEDRKHELNTTLNNILGINGKLLRSNARLIISSVLKLVEKDSWCRDQVIDNEEYWTLLSHLAVEAPEDVYNVVSTIEKVDEKNYESILKCLGTITAALSSNEELALKVVESIDSMGSYNFKSSEYSFIQTLSTQCAHPKRQVREKALKRLQAVLLSPELEDNSQVFESAIFPLIELLLKPEVFELDPKGMEVMRLDVASLMCKAFLQYAVSQSCNKQVLELWVKILETLDRLVNSGQKDEIQESVVESLKNVLLVVSSNEFGADDEFWGETWKRIDSFLPQLREEVFPSSPLESSVESVESVGENGEKEKEEETEAKAEAEDEKEKEKEKGITNDNE